MLAGLGLRYEREGMAPTAYILDLFPELEDMSIPMGDVAVPLEQHESHGGLLPQRDLHAQAAAARLRDRVAAIAAGSRHHAFRYFRQALYADERT